MIESLKGAKYGPKRFVSMAGEKVSNMVWAAPWLRGRKALMALASLDAFLCFGWYGVVLRARLPEINIFHRGSLFITFTWVILSYVAGRYTESQKSLNEENLPTQIAKSVAISVVILTILVVHAWIFQVDGAETKFRGFLLPLLALISISSACAKSVLTKMRKGEQEVWYIVCDKAQREIVEAEMISINRRVKVSFIDVDDERVVSTLGSRGAKRVAVSYVDKKNKDLEFFLTKQKAKGLIVCRLEEWSEEYLQRVPPEFLEHDWFIFNRNSYMQPGGIGWRIKRAGDIFIAGCLVFATLPLFIISAVLIWFEDKGPVLYGQTRTGLYGEKIKIWKLRSMIVDAEKGGAVWARKKDPRITKVGSIIRRLRIDELPQLLAVIRGDLSLIGPRPERPDIEKEFEDTIPHYLARTWIKPGLSGWAQVSYPYGSSIKDTRMKLAYDLYYLRNAGLLFDFMIMIKTIKLVARGEGSSPGLRE